MKKVGIFLQFVILMASMIFLCACEKKVTMIPTITKNQTKQESFIIEVRGEVSYPGVYSITEGSLVMDAIKLAGGLTSNADLSTINLVMVLTNHQLLSIPSKKTQENNTTSMEEKKININKATIEELCKVPSIGKVMAERIVAYRNKYGSFQSLEDLKNVSGIGDATFEKIQTYLSL
jgi:competence protein ComEA